MHYELYIDLFFLVNFLMDYFLLLLTGKMIRCRIRRFRIAAGAASGAFLTCIVVVFLRGSLWKLCVFHGVINFIMLKMGLGIKEKYTLVRAWILLYISAILMGGFLNFFQPYIKIGSVFLIFSVGGYYLCCGMWNFLCYLRRNQSGFCMVSLYRKGCICQLRGIVDTGNRLRDDLSGKPVHVIAKNTAEQLGIDNLDEQRVITYQSVGKENGTMPVIVIDRMSYCCEQEEKWVEKPLVAVSEERAFSEIYDIILNPDDL